MSWTIEGRYFPPASVQPVPALASAEDGRLLRIAGEAGEPLAETGARAVVVSARLARLPRRFDFPDGGRFETTNIDGADALLKVLHKHRPGRTTDRMGRGWPVVAGAMILILAILAFMVFQAVPQTAAWLAQRTAPSIAHAVSEQTLAALDHDAFAPTKLSAADQAKADELFARVAARAKGGAGAYRLVFRDGARVGPNAVSLPDGTIVMTDQLWTFAGSDAEIEGVFAHEMSHVDHAHQLRRAYEAVLGSATVAVVTGDMTEVGKLAQILQGLILQSAYSRAFETQADDDAAATLRALGERPSRLADLLTRIEAKTCGAALCLPSWIGDHPDTKARAARLRAEDKGPLPKQDCWHAWRHGFSPQCLGWN